MIQIEDYRQENKIKHALHDCYMSAFAMMYFQDPALLEFQRRLQDITNLNNLKTTFNVASIPKDSQLRSVLDKCSNDELLSLFPDLIRPFQRGKQLEQFQFINNSYFVALDGSGYFSSNKIQCPGCLTKTSKKTGTRYEHQILQAAIVCPGIRQVIPLMPEPIKNTDGKDKQDCEINAAKRLLPKIRRVHPKLNVIILADDLYSKQPFIDSLKQNRMSFILVAKPSDHKMLHEQIDEFKAMKETSVLEFKDDKNRTHQYEWMNHVLLNGTKDADYVNYFEYKIIQDNKIRFKNNWVTDLEITSRNITQLVKGSRTRWKIENETFNTLKNQGYHIEHNYGHGEKNLSFTFFILNLIAFLIHQILELCDPLYQKCRKKFSSRKEFWNQLRCTFRILVFQNWEHMVGFIISPPNEPIPP